MIQNKFGPYILLTTCKNTEHLAALDAGFKLSFYPFFESYDLIIEEKISSHSTSKSLQKILLTILPEVLCPCLHILLVFSPLSPQPIKTLYK